MRYVYAFTAALLVSGSALALTGQLPAGAQTVSLVADAASTAGPRAVPRSGAPESFADLVERLQPAVVNIATRQQVRLGTRINPFEGTREPVTQEQEGGGSGFFISADGYIVTNDHVIAGQRARGGGSQAVDEVTVILTDRREFRARIVGRDPTSDLALLKIEATGMPFVKFAPSGTARVGDWVVAIGNPLGLGSTVTAGIISALQRNVGTRGAYDRYIQTDTAINRGNSGGPLFDLDGNVVGVNNMLISPVGANIGVNFAIPADAAVPVIEALRAGAPPARGYLGISIEPVGEDLAAALGVTKNRGEFVQRVEPGEAADKAGLKRGDVVTKVNGRDVTPDQSLSFIVSNVRPGTRIPLEVLRDGKTLTLNATVGTRPTEEKLAQRQFDPEASSDLPDNADAAADQVIQRELGLAVQPLTPDIARSLGVPSGTTGVVVGAVASTSDAARRGLRRGVVITSAGRQPVTTAEALAKAVTDAKAAGRTALLLEVVLRGNPPEFVTLRLRP